MSFNATPFRCRPFAVLIFGWLIFPLLYWYLLSLFEKVDISNDEVIYQNGIFSKLKIELRKNQIRSIVINQSFFNRIFNCGTLEIFTSGDKPELTLKNFPSPGMIEKQLKTYVKN